MQVHNWYSIVMVSTIDNRILNLQTEYSSGIPNGKILNFHGTKNGGHFKRRAAIGQRNTPHHNYISVHAQKLTSSCLHM